MICILVVPKQPVMIKLQFTETEEDRFIRYADTISCHSDFNGELNKECLDFHITLWDMNSKPLPPALAAIRNEIFKLQPKNNDGNTVYVDITSKYISSNYDNVKNHLLKNGYIDQPELFAQKWVLNERGKDMKRLKGHKKYQKYLDNKLKAEIIEINGKIHWLRRVIIAAIVASIVGYGLRYLTEPKEKTQTDQSSKVEK